MTNKLTMDIERGEHHVQISENRLSQRAYKFANDNGKMRECIPMDLSQRRDSVETRKTPSPYDSFNGSNPSSVVHSPSSGMSAAAAIFNAIHSRSSTPNHYPQSTNSVYGGVPIGYPHMLYPFTTKSGGSSPSGDDAMRQQWQQFELAAKAALIGHPTEEVNAYMLQMMAQQQSAAQTLLRNDSEESSESLPSARDIKTMKKDSPINTNFPLPTTRDGKPARPFKAYPHDPLSISSSFAITDSPVDKESTEKYHVFRHQMFEQIIAANGGQATVSNPRMRRTTASAEAAELNAQANNSDSKSIVDGDDSAGSTASGSIGAGGIIKDSMYFERRKKNNAAAKKSRDRRRIKEDELAIRAAFLERENIELRHEVATLRRQLEHFVKHTM